MDRAPGSRAALVPSLDCLVFAVCGSLCVVVVGTLAAQGCGGGHGKVTPNVLLSRRLLHILFADVHLL